MIRTALTFVRYAAASIANVGFGVGLVLQ